jgi:hypothetical protein
VVAVLDGARHVRVLEEVSMTERPILFSAPMVRAILTGQKTQTRRIVNPQPERVREHMDGRIRVPDGWRWRECYGADDGGGFAEELAANCRYGNVGDRLWVKETWRTSVCCDDKAPSVLETPGNGFGWPVWYAADGGAVTWRGAKEGGPGFVNPGKTRVSIHMPRWASRITLAITSVRAEGLHDIGEADAKAEGAACRIAPGGDLAGAFAGLGGDVNYRAHFRDLWDSINGERAPWASNPWVWAVTFEVAR